MLGAPLPRDVPPESDCEKQVCESPGTEHCPRSEKRGDLSLDRPQNCLGTLDRRPEVRNNEHAPTRLPGDSDDLCLFHGRFVVVLVGEGVGVPSGDEPTVGFADDAVSGEPSALYRFGLEDDHVALVDGPREFCRNRDEPVARF